MDATGKTHRHGFVPALGYDLLTPLYDTLVAVTLNERAVKQQLVAQARIAPGMTVVDLGCGTGTLVLMIKRAQPAAHVIGVDVDAKILGIARAKLDAAGVDVELREGLVQEVGLAPGSIDRVLTSLVLHHLTSDEKVAALHTLHTALRPGGELHVLDFGPPHNVLMSLVSAPFRFFDGHSRTDDNFSGRMPEIIARAGFRDVAERGHRMTVFGTLVYWSAVA
ncbi:class I SAM-dependent methyltransferase [Candidatus Binatia bacterium]|jgi:ubiquinone/menaquinone biosynthesis C-methylase UbiE|nr:class I SAM-dependent methyltransferase [Candidatus Binatia bacterium]